MKKCAVIYNPHSGKKGKKDFFEEFFKILTDNNYEAEVHFSKYRGHIIDIVSSLSDDISLVISLGGDGTFNESMRGNFRRKKRLVLAHIPIGTTNDVGKMFGYGKNVISNLKLLMNGVVKNVDICTINDEPFVYVAGFGKFMNIPYETSRKSKKKLGYLAYLLNGARDFVKFTRLHDITYIVDGEEYNGLYSFMFVANATRIAGVNNVFYDVKLNDNKFEVLLCNLRWKKDVIRTLYYLRKTDITRVPGFYFHKASSIKIKVNDEKKIPWCIDGEKLEIDSSEVEIKIDKNVKLMIPNNNIDKLFVKKGSKN